MRGARRAATAQGHRWLLGGASARKRHYTPMSRHEASRFQPPRLLPRPSRLHCADRNTRKLPKLISHSAAPDKQSGPARPTVQTAEVTFTGSKGWAAVGSSPFLLPTWDGWAMRATVRGPGRCRGARLCQSSLSPGPPGPDSP